MKISDKLKGRMKEFWTIQNLITLNLVAWSAAYMLSVCNVSLYRLWSSICDLGRSIGYWFTDMLHKLSRSSGPPSVSVSVNDIPKVDIQRYIPFDLEEFKLRISRLHLDIIDLDNLKEFNVYFVFELYKFLVFTMFFIFVIAFATFICHDSLTEENEKENGTVSKWYNKLLSFNYRHIRPAIRKVGDYFSDLMPSLGFSRQEHWSGLPFPSPVQESEK